jgi:hypothetical protein
MKIELTSNIEIDSFYMGFSEPEVYEEEQVIESPWCPFCGEGQNHKDIKICLPCQDNFTPENLVWNAYWNAERAMAKLKKIEF